MITIQKYEKGRITGFAKDSFSNEFFKICEEHKRSGRALLFAFLLYDFGQAEIIKVLKDDDYWNGLDKLSGTTFSVFAFHSPNIKRHRESKFDEQAKEIIGENFNVEDSLPVPCILFFQVIGEKVSNYYCVKIRAKKKEESYQEIRQIIEVAKESLEKVTPDNFGNSKEIFDLVSQSLKQRNFIGSVLYVIEKMKSVKEIVGWFAR